MIYGIHLTLATLAHAAAWIYASFRPQLLIPDVTPKYLAMSRIATLALAFGYALATVLGLICRLPDSSATSSCPCRSSWVVLPGAESAHTQ